MDESRFTPEELDYLIELSKEFEHTLENIQDVDQQHVDDMGIFTGVGLFGGFLSVIGMVESTSEQARAVGVPFLMVGGAAVIFAAGGALYERRKYRRVTR